MARYEHLPIYQAAFDLAVHIEKIVRNFSRYHKYTLGTELRDGSRRILERIIEATRAATVVRCWSSCAGSWRVSRCWPGCVTSRRGSAAPGPICTSPSRWWASRSRTKVGSGRRLGRGRVATPKIDQGRRGVARTGRALEDRPGEPVSPLCVRSARPCGGHVRAGVRTPPSWGSAAGGPGFGQGGSRRNRQGSPLRDLRRLRDADGHRRSHLEDSAGTELQGVCEQRGTGWGPVWGRPEPLPPAAVGRANAGEEPGHARATTQTRYRGPAGRRAGRRSAWRSGSLKRASAD